ncbi:hypothetical protein [Rivularia sp. UHCC 0363]|uniref:hypothetical protein n=1 Tax=Rivularia sp. UHCC 0363 TaxID=3110244 RepID=UPI002B1EE99E|nr:hypothetical protein [Rivularia sp. UHCC 0363]MEA5595677.1 hypothetical protein [Rivularia sp. UHCC 0363]
MLKRLGFVDKNKIWDFVRKYEDKLDFEKWNGKYNDSGRKCLWLGVGVDLGLRSKVYEGEVIDKNLRLRINSLWGSNHWNSILIYKYEKGVELKLHRDRDIFEDKVIIINVSNDDLFGGNVEFVYDNCKEILSNGEIIEFNNKKIHGVKKVINERWSISIRKVKV